MRCPTLLELPPSSSGKTGWPWTEETPQFPDTMADGHPWPKISIVTPSYNQGQFIEETIRSVLLQGYPNLEYIIIDGGSSDNSVEIIRKYGKWLTYWVSEPDKGQVHAINKGFDKCRGEIIAWLNSDDYYYPNILRPVIQLFVKYPKIALVHGWEQHVDINSRLVGNYFPRFKNARAVTLFSGDTLLQLACFWRKETYHTVGGLDESLNYHLDYDFFLKLSYRYPSKYVPLCVGAFRRYPEQKSAMKKECNAERDKVYKRFLTQISMPAWKYNILRSWYSAVFVWKYDGFLGIIKGIMRRAKKWWKRQCTDWQFME